MLLSVKRLGSTREPYEVELFLKPPRLADLKEALLEKSGIPIWAQRVFYDGKCLRSTKTLEEQGLVVNGNCILHLAASAHYKAPPAPPEPPAPPPQLAHGAAPAAPAAAGPPDPAVVSPEPAAASSAEGAGGAPVEAPAEEADLSKLPVAELKQRLKERGVSYEGCTEKSDLVDLLRDCIFNNVWPQEPPPRAATFAGPCLGPGAAPFSFGAAGAPGAGQAANPLAALFSQLGPMVGTAMNQALAQAQQQNPPGNAGGAAIPVPPAGAPAGAAPRFAAPPQEQQQAPQWGAPQGAGVPASMATLLQQLGPQIASQMGTPPHQTQDFGDITFTTDMNFVMGPPMGVPAGAAPTVDAATLEGTQPAASAAPGPPAEAGSGDAGGEGGHQFL